MEEKPKKVAIVGGGPSRRRAPYDDETWEIWAFSSRAWRYPRVTRWFELHSMTDLRDQLSTYRPGRRSVSRLHADAPEDELSDLHAKGASFHPHECGVSLGARTRAVWALLYEHRIVRRRPGDNRGV